MVSTGSTGGSDGTADGLDLEGLADRLDERLEDADERLATRYPGDRPGRQPVHTVYVPADRYAAGLAHRWANRAEIALIEHGALFLEVIGGDEVLLNRVLLKLEREPVEDLRIDVEDGYADRGDDTEDADVLAAAAALRADVDAGAAPPYVGLRFKSLEAPTRRRGLRSLGLFVQALAADGPLPPGFVVTLPKVTSVDQVRAMVDAACHLEQRTGLDEGALRFEIQVETPQAVLGHKGASPLPAMIHAADGRCTGLHFGTYDDSASLGIAAAQQSMEHPAADHVKAVMQVAVAGTGVRVSDGSTNVLPVGDEADVRRGWELHHRLVTRSLERGFYQGWDLHPAQLPTRYAATYRFFRAARVDATTRLRAYAEQRAGAIADEPATVKALAGYLLRGFECGALTSAEVTGPSGHDLTTLARLAGRLS
jgi:citrate lyase beta subunit